jgi:soluble lytic murein transglycosylase-like protein
MLALTHSTQLSGLGLEIAKRALTDRAAGWLETEFDAALYPVPPWRPQKGFQIDRALIFAFMRQESSFDPLAKSPDGARGLMQLMPRTAASLDKNRGFKGRQRDELYDPSLNMSLGQRYLSQLLRSRRVGNDVLRLAAAYNAGPGNLGRWERRMDYSDDPLLFIETLPVLETRLFVERVLTNLWIYRQRFGQAAPTLLALASGRWPTYRALDQRALQVASRHEPELD